MEKLLNPTFIIPRSWLLAYGAGVLALSLYLGQYGGKWAVVTALFLFSLAFFACKLEWLIYLLAFFLPVIHWDFYIGPLIVPLIDLLAILALGAFFLRYFTLYLKSTQPVARLIWPFLLPYALFAGVAVISALMAPKELDSLWYAVRWILFFYMAYVFIPVNTIKDKATLEKTVWAFILSAAVTGLMGIASLWGQDWRHAYVRILPLRVGTVWPLGDNQNLIAEVLLPAVFYVAMFRYLAGTELKRKVLGLLNIFLVAVLVLTFSRGAWISLLVCGFLYLFYYYRHEVRRIILPAYIVFVLMVPVFFYMYMMQTDYNIGIGSTRSRLQSTQIAVAAFLDKPWFGYGPGQYIDLVDDNIRFIATFGNPLESHGILQKIMAEMGGLGLLAFLIMTVAIVGRIIYYIRKYPEQRPWLVPLALAALSIFIFELTNTSYYKGKLWLPVALAFLGGPVLTGFARNKARINAKAGN